MQEAIQIAKEDYSSDSPNLINKLFYQHAKSSLIKQLPNLFVSLELFHQALYRRLTSEVKSDPIKVKELAGGESPGVWETSIDINKNRRWEITLTDFSRKIIDNIDLSNNNDNFKFNFEVLDLFEPFDLLELNDRYDVFFSTYTFDNIWLPEDLHLLKSKDKWFKTEYKIIFPKTTSGLQIGRRSLSTSFFKNIKIKTRQKEIDPDRIEHGSLIKEYFSNLNNVEFNHPGGLINKVIQSFKKQLKDDGVFITADMAKVDKTVMSKPYITVIDSLKIKVEDYGLGKFILESLGYSVELKSLFEFIKNAGVETPVNIYDHFVLLVKKEI